MKSRLLLPRIGRIVPVEYRANFRHLYFDIAWYALLAGGALAFVGVYAARLGAIALHLGLLNAGPAAINLLVTLPAGRWLEHRPLDRAVLWTAILSRVWYVAWIFLPLLLGPQGQVWALIVLTLVIAIPGAALMVGFNVLFAETVPPEWRGYVAGVRNALFAVVFVITSLLSGVILRRLPFPVGYQVIFGLGCLGAGMSAVHLAFIHLPKEEPRANRDAKPAPSAMPPSTESPIGGAPRSQVGLRFLRNRIPNLRADVLRGSFGGVVASIGVFHLAFFLAIPLFPLFLVDRLHFNDQQISLGTAVYYLTFFMGSLLLDQATRRLGNHRLFTLGAVLGSLYPVLIAITPGLGLYLITSAIGGIAGALFAGALANYVLERAPADQRPAAMAWYNLAINAGVLLGSLAGPVVAEVTGLVAALIAFAAIRWLAAFALLRWGK